MTKPETEWVIVKPRSIYCLVTKNPFGSDTWCVGQSCQCANCQAMLAASPPAPSVPDVVAVGCRYLYPDGGEGTWRFTDGRSINGVYPIKNETVYSSATVAAQAKTIEGLAPLRTILDMTETATSEQVVEQVKRLVADKIQSRVTVTELRTANSQLVVRYEFALSEQKAAEAALETARGALGRCLKAMEISQSFGSNTDWTRMIAGAREALAALPSPPITKTGEK